MFFLGTLPLCYFSQYLSNGIDINNFTKLIIVRNPYYRMTSNFVKHHLCQQLAKEGLKKLNISKNLISKSNDFLHEIELILKKKSLDELIKPGPKHINHLIPQVEYIKNKDNKYINDINILKLEKLNEELPIFLKKLGVNYNKNIHANQSGYNNNSYKLFYNNKSTCKEIQHLANDNVSIIRRIYKNDFEVFDYPLDI